MKEEKILERRQEKKSALREKIIRYVRNGLGER